MKNWLVGTLGAVAASLCVTAALADDSVKKAGGDHGARLAGMFKHFDINSDGKVTAEEAAQRSKEHFDHLVAKADKDGDKAISMAEANDGVREMYAAWQQQGAQGHGDQKHAGEHMQDHFASIDKDGDKKISKEEAMAQFKSMDKNGDGFVDAQEIHASASSDDHKEHEHKEAAGAGSSGG